MALERVWKDEELGDGRKREMKYEIECLLELTVSWKVSHCKLKLWPERYHPILLGEEIWLVRGRKVPLTGIIN